MRKPVNLFYFSGSVNVKAHPGGWWQETAVKCDPFAKQSIHRPTPCRVGRNSQEDMIVIPVLFTRQDSEYKNMPGTDCYDADRNALSYAGSLPVVAHPPCRAWGVLSHMANPAPGEKELAIWAIALIRKNGGVMEHPAGSKLWKELNLPNPGWLPDEYGGYTLLIDQYDFGHVARKPTHLYIVGVARKDLPELPPRRWGTPQKSITGQVGGTKRCTQKEREYTPVLLREWLVAVAQIANKRTP